MSKSTPMFLYNIADALGTVLEVKQSQIRGKSKRRVDFNGLRVSFDTNIVSSFVQGSSAVVLARIAGNLAVAVYATGISRDARFYLLDLAKLGSADGLFEKKAPVDCAAARAILEPAIVQSFERVPGGAWREAV